jgi:CheY-like chemotaxis protein
MKAHDIPTDTLEVGQIRVLIIDSDWEGSEHLASGLQAKDSYEVRTARSSFDAGVIAQKLIPHVIMINLMAEGIDAREVSRYVRSNEELDGTKLVAIARNLGENEQNALCRQGFDAVVTDPDNIAGAAAVIQQVTAIIY